MGVLEQIMQMKREEKTDEEIISRLREQGISPKAINDAFNQARIKNAVSDIRGVEETEYPGNTGTYAEPLPPSPNQPYQPYQYAQTQEMEVPEPDLYAPQPSPPQQEKEYYPRAEEYPQGEYYEGYEGGYAPQAGLNTDTIIEISEQVFSEKIRKIRKQIEEMKEFRTLTQTKLDNALDRLKRAENMMDKLQISILDKIGSYGKNLEGIKKEMSMMQDSFGKMVGPIAERKVEKHPQRTAHKTKRKAASKKG